MTKGRLRAITSYWLRHQDGTVTAEIALKHITEMANELERHGALSDGGPSTPPDFIRTSTPLVTLGQGDYKRDIMPEDV